MSSSIRIRSTLSAAVAAALLLGLSACGNNNAPANNAAPGQPAKTASAPAKPAATPASASTQAQAQAEQAARAAQAKLDSMSVKDLLAAGNTAINQQKLVAPKGDNAFEYYEKALEKDPKNQAAQDALREQFPFGANAVETAIGQNNFDEAQREIGLLAKADPGNYTLKILNSKLDAAKKQQQRLADQKAKQAAELAARQAAEAKAAAAKTASAPPPAPPPVQKPVVQAQPTPPPAQAAPKPAAPPPQAAGETRGPQVVSAAAPDYPIEAARNHQSGYATVEFTVNPDGSVSNAHVINANPPRVFNSAAIQAVSRSKFKPALKDGQPVASTLQRRIDFNLGG
ncbi:MAG TPA: energy transducer TonB [Rhodanobacteraceae bacterium]|nr:energy transducer TonB [Rhodanobacteraceae bacterium]